MPMEISLIIPAYNEEKRILNTLIETIDYLEKTAKNYEIIVVDDGSQDETAALCGALCPYVRLVSYKQNKGKGFAVSKGVEAATGDFVFFTDADLSYSPRYILRAEELLRTGFEVVLGRRSDSRDGYPTLRKLCSRAYRCAAERILPIFAADMQCGFKGFRAEAAKTLFSDLKICGFAFDAEIISKAERLNMEISQMPICFEHKQNSSVSVRSGIKMLFDLLRIRRELENGGGG